MNRQSRNQEALVVKTLDLSRKMRELSCLYRISDVIDQRGRPLGDIVRGVLEVIPGMTDHPETLCARITIDGLEYRTDNFRPTSTGLASDIVSRCSVAGTLEVFSLDEHTAGVPFTREEKRLVDNIASRLGRVVARKRAEEMLTESEERYRSLFEDSRDAILTVSGDGVILDANSSALDLFGYPRAEMLGMNAVLFFSAEADMAGFVSEVRKTGSVRNYEVRLRKKDGTEMDCLCTASLLAAKTDNTVAGYHSIIRDITRDKRSEQERLALISELRSALDSIRTLKGLVPICASCKKIRDDKGYWNRLEEYIEAQTEAVFSHGLCPECRKRFEEE
ncbi:MAG TPA: PAS domain S-box protein [Deltaproteobacteria bacterium]|nr:PAS domain S-box protein [Deltaproteobacteria bacterium]HOI06275.1 PAS domain S-box protein [Deltaproteobacteria bacterium]